MSARNPKSGIEALIGKTYTLKGRECHNTMLALMALEAAGIPLTQVRAEPYRASAILAWAMLSPMDEVSKAIADKDVVRRGIEFAKEWSPEDLGEATAICYECIARFNHSITSYFNPAAKKGKNAQTG